MSGLGRIEEWLVRHEGAMMAALGVTPMTFSALVGELCTHGRMVGSRYIAPREQLAHFLYIAREGTGVRRTAEAFNRSLDTINR